MALVDYSSSPSTADSEASDPSTPPAKRRKHGARGGQAASSSAAVSKDGDEEAAAAPSAMPPLPSAFHDLYASTVRQSVRDDPALHQGRRRQTPHVPGNWPSHVYVEWYPSEAQHGLLDKLLNVVEEKLGEDMKLHKFLTSDLGAHLPLHISLSRPLSLRTADKDGFLEGLTQGIRRSGTGPFTLRPAGLAWYRSPDSDRTFLILRVETAAGSGNPQLMRLLRRCNGVAAEFQQPPLYQRTQDEVVDEAFHISVAWTFGLPDGETALGVLALFREQPFRGMRAWDIDVSGVKVKIGNVVNHVPLVELGTQPAAVSSSLLFES
ncbi:hypothetical protein HIM_06851 [Hirsutella minnesotensis 3608]|uniref:U6 snRNA phosphodiesterase n=1 Tax=Hirsutella minnesotensis 3608 TaxID=1043627 RepID=A0A0F7ZTU7_9HYPO|nr:hypothetical protein HIM_06851 [Hirsutella minnesotensis 3608]